MPNISLFYGDEDYLLDEELKSIKKNYSEFNFERIDGSKAGEDQIISALSSLPMLGGTKLAIIDEFEYKEENEERLFKVLQDIDQNIKVIFVYYDGIDRRKRFYKLIEKIGEVREFKMWSEWETDKVLSWLVGRIKLYKKKISGAAANLLVEIVGSNLRMLDKEIEKIATYIGDKEMIEEQDVKAVASSGDADAFALSNALRNKNIPEAIKSLNMLFKDNHDPHMLIGMLAKLYRMLLQVKYLEDKGKNQYEIAQEIKAKPFYIKKCMEKTRSFSLQELAKNLKILHLADLKMKSGSPARRTLELLIPDLCHEQ